MHIYRTMVPGSGVLHQILTRDEPTRAIVLEPDEADQVAELLANRPVADRLLSRQRRVDELIGERGR